MEGLAPLLFEALKKDGWVELLSIEFIYFTDIEPAVNSNVIRHENTPTSLPVITVGNVKRLMNAEYRLAAALGMAEILFYLEDNLGAGRLFIP